MKKIREIASNYLKKQGYGVIDFTQYLIDLDKDFFDIWDKVKDYTMISIERAYSLYLSVEYICRNRIKGDIVECGVWKGGACMIAALTLIKNNCTDRSIYLFDTFEGMPSPGDNDKVSWNGKKAYEYWNKSLKATGKKMFAAGFDEVKNNMHLTGYPCEKIILNQGDVAETLKSSSIPSIISLLRLDTDWYESTKIELEILYPCLSQRGVLIIDDYGHFTGARKAVDEYFSRPDIPGILLNRIDYTGRTGVKIDQEQSSDR